jgi:hypothetical protein
LRRSIHLASLDLLQHAAHSLDAIVKNLSLTGDLTRVVDIPKSHASRLRVSLTEWRGRWSVELRETTATIPGC